MRFVDTALPTAAVGFVALQWGGDVEDVCMGMGWPRRGGRAAVPPTQW
jgi:hypothetical protein